MVVVQATAVEHNKQGRKQKTSQDTHQFRTILSVCLWTDFCQCNSFKNILSFEIKMQVH